MSKNGKNKDKSTITHIAEHEIITHIDMKNSNDMFTSLVGQAGKTLLDSTNEKNHSAQIKLFLALLGIFIFVGAEGIKVFFRKNFGKEGISLTRVIICFLSFIGISAISFSLIDDSSSKLGSQLSFGIMGSFYVFVAFYILFKGIQAKKESRTNTHLYDDYKGDSILLDFLIKEGWKQSTVQNVAEPVATILVGIFLTFFNYIWGIPLFFCAISLWLNQLVEYIFGFNNHVNQVLVQQGHSTQQSSGSNFGQATI